MGNLPTTEGYERSATSLNRGGNGFKISRDIDCLTFDMSRGQPADKVRCQLKEIQTDYDEVVKLLRKLYKYTDEPHSVTLKKWQSALREDFLSIEHAVRRYGQEKQISPDKQTDTGRSGCSTAKRREIEPLTSESADVMSPPPEDLKFNTLLLKLAGRIRDSELKMMKFLFRGPGIITMRDLEDTSHPMEFFDKLRKSGHLAPNNIVALQAVLWNTENIELFNEVKQFAEGMKDMVYVSEPNSTPANGYKHVKLHFKQRPLRETVEVVQQRTAAWFGTHVQFVSVVGSEPANSWYITLMIPEICTEKFQRSVELNRKWFSEQGVVFVELNGRTINVTDEKATDSLACNGNIGDISKPKLRFTQTSDEGLRITGEGAVVKAKDLSGWPVAVTDGKFGAGRCY